MNESVTKSDNRVGRARPTIVAPCGTRNGLSGVPRLDGEFSLSHLDDHERKQSGQQVTGSLTGYVPTVNGRPLRFFDPCFAVDVVGLSAEVRFDPVEKRSVTVVDVKPHIEGGFLEQHEFNRTLSVNDSSEVGEMSVLHIGEYSTHLAKVGS